jgi:hypothetical protein
MTEAMVVEDWIRRSLEPTIYYPLFAAFSIFFASTDQ